MKKTKTLFFDFDGTIVDSKEAYYDAIGDVLKVFGLSSKEIDKAIDLGFSLKKMLRKLGFSWVSTWFLKKKIMKKVKKRIMEVKKCRNIEFIGKLRGKKILVTNSLKGFVMPVLKHLKIKKYFSKVYGADDFNDKAEFLRNYIAKRKLDKDDCYYIGDRIKDVEIAKKVGCKSVIISNKCSWDSPSELKKAKPDFLVRGLGGLNKVLKNQNK